MNVIKWMARKILAKELTSMALTTVSEQRELTLLREDNENLKVDLFQSSQLIQHHEKRIKQMAPEKQFVVVAVDGTHLEQEMVYSSAGFTRITVRLPLGHPWKQATELAQQLELANMSLDRARGVMFDDPEMRRKFLALTPSGEADGR